MWILSKKFMELYNTVISDVFAQWGTPTRDLFVSHANSKCIKYCSRVGLSSHFLVIHWLDQTNYAFPPLPLLLRISTRSGGRWPQLF